MGNIYQFILYLLSCDFRTEGIEADIDIFVATVDLVDVADHAGALRGS